MIVQRNKLVLIYLEPRQRIISTVGSVQLILVTVHYTIIGLYGSIENSIIPDDAHVELLL